MKRLIRNPRFTSLLNWVSQISPETHLNPSKSRPFATHGTRNSIRITPSIRRIAEEAMLDYFYSTRGLQYMVAESMSKNSPVFIDKLLNKIDSVSSPSDINQSITRHLRFHPINEFEPFLESSGLKPKEYSHLVPCEKLFLSDDVYLLENHHVLCYSGIDPKKIGKVFKEAREVFNYKTGVLASKIKACEDLGFSRLLLSKLIVCSPRILIGDMNVELAKVFEILKSIGFESDWLMKNLSEDVSYDWSFVLRALSLLRDIFVDDDELCGLIKNHPRLVFEDSGKWTLILTGFETKLGLSRTELRCFFQKYTEIEVEKCVVNLRQCFLFLKEIEMENDEIHKVFCSHSWWISTCKLKKTGSLFLNLKAHKSRISQVVKESPEEMKKWTIGSKIKPLPSNKVDIESKEKKIRFLLELGYEEDSKEMERALKSFRGRGSELRKRFDFLVSLGLSEEEVKDMVKASPDVLSLASDIIESKVNYLVKELGYSLSALVAFPSCLKFTLQRMKLRFAMFSWLQARGKVDSKLAISTILACSDKYFATFFVNRDPEGPKQMENLKKVLDFEL